jgi:hypothetical protein
MALMYFDYDKTTHAARVQSYLKAMEALAARYPDDDEADLLRDYAQRCGLAR